MKMEEKICTQCKTLKPFCQQEYSLTYYNLPLESPKCAICDIALKWKPGKLQLNSPTLDRKNNEQILNMENVWIICHKCNTMKSINSLNELIAWCKMVVEKFDGVE